MKKKVLSFVLALTLVLGTMVMPHLAFAAPAEYEFLMSEATLPSADCFEMVDGWVAVRTREGTGGVDTGDGIKNMLNTTKEADEAITVTTHFMTGSKPTKAKMSFLIRMGLRPSPTGGGEWFHPFELYSEPSLDRPRLQFASNKDSTTFVPATLDTKTGSLDLEYDSEYIMKTTIAPNEFGNAYFVVEIYSVNDGAPDKLLGKGEVLDLVFDSSYAAQFSGLPVVEYVSVMSLNKTSAIDIEEPVAYVNSVKFKIGVYEDETPKTQGTAEFYDAALSESKTLIDDVLVDQATTYEKFNDYEDQYANITDAAVLAGKKWYTMDMSSEAEKVFLKEDGWLTVRPFQQKNNGNWRYYQYNRAKPKYVKCFEPITDGSAFTVKSTITPLKSPLPRVLTTTETSQMGQGFNVQLRLTNDEWNGLGERSGDYSSVFNIFSYGINQEERSLAAVAGVDQLSVNVGGVNAADSNYAAKTPLSYDITLHGKEIAVEAKFIPDGDNYNVTVTCTDPDGNVLLTNAEPVVIAKETVAGYSRFQISATFDDCVEMTDEQAALRYAKIKDVSITTMGTESALKAGVNKIYIPFKRTSGDYFNAAIIAAIYNGDMQESFVIKEVKECLDADGNIDIDVTITDAGNQSVRCFVFDSFENLKSISKSKIPLYSEK